MRLLLACASLVALVLTEGSGSNSGVDYGSSGGGGGSATGEGGGSGVAEVQAVKCTADGGTFRLSFDGVDTVAIEAGASPAMVQMAFASLPQVHDSTTVSFSRAGQACRRDGSNFMSITFGGSAGDVPLVTADSGDLTLSAQSPAAADGGGGDAATEPSIEVVEVTKGGGGAHGSAHGSDHGSDYGSSGGGGGGGVAEVQAVKCTADGGTFRLSFDGVDTVAIEAGASPAMVQMAFASLPQVHDSTTVSFSRAGQACRRDGSNFMSITFGGSAGDVPLVTADSGDLTLSAQSPAAADGGGGDAATEPSIEVVEVTKGGGGAYGSAHGSDHGSDHGSNSGVDYGGSGGGGGSATGDEGGGSPYDDHPPAPAPPHVSAPFGNLLQTHNLLPAFQQHMPSATALFDDENRTYFMQLASFSKSPTKGKADDPDFWGKLVLASDLGDPNGIHITDRNIWRPGLNCTSVQGAILVSRRGGYYGQDYSEKARAAEAVGAGAVITIGDISTDFSVHTPMSAGTVASIPSYYMPAYAATQLLGACQDEGRFCRQWEKEGECKKNAPFMHLKCRRSCGVCSAAEIHSCTNCAEKEAAGEHCTCRAPNNLFRLETATTVDQVQLGAVVELYNSMTNKGAWKFGRLGRQFDVTKWHGKSALGPSVAPWSVLDEGATDICGRQGKRLWGVMCEGNNVVSIDLSFGVSNAGNSWTMPASIGMLAELRFFAMPGLGGVGTLPVHMAALSNLLVLRLEHNAFSGELPAIGFSSSDPPGSSLVYADLSGNNMTDLASNSIHHHLLTLVGLATPTRVCSRPASNCPTPRLLMASKNANIYARYAGVENKTLSVADFGTYVSQLEPHPAALDIACSSNWKPNDFPGAGGGTGNGGSAGGGDANSDGSTGSNTAF